MRNHPLATHLSSFHLLKHAYYQAWTDGALSRESLQAYACQYFHHVEAFPRYISAIHSNCESPKARQELLENLIEEERGEENHPRLWLNFAEGLGASEARARETKLFPETRELIDTFLGLARASYSEGLGALYAYEHQVPEVAKFKREALANRFDVKDERALKFFAVHEKADVVHSQVVADLIDALPEAERAKAYAAAEICARALWRFLDGVQARTCPTAA